MRTVLVIAQHPSVAETLRGFLNPDHFHVLHRVDQADAEALIRSRGLDVCLLDVEETRIESVWVLEKIRSWHPKCPVLLLTGPGTWDWEEDAYELEVAHVLRKPLRRRIITAILQRIFQAPETTAPQPRSRAPIPRAPAPPPLVPAPGPTTLQKLETLGLFAPVWTHALHLEPMLKEFLWQLRRILGVNRAAVFLRPAGAGPMRLAAGEHKGLRPATVIGLATDLVRQLEVTLDSGIGEYVFREGRVLRRDSEEAQADPECARQFELMGMDIALPIPAEQGLLGLAFFDRRLGGEPLTPAEVEQVFHLMESLGLAIHSIWRHAQVAANQELLAEILRELGSGCIVISRDLAILHANPRAIEYFGQPGQGSLAFSDIPVPVGAKVYQVLKTGDAIPPFIYCAPESSRVFHVTVLPFRRRDDAPPDSALLVAEDKSREEQVQRLEIEAANLRLLQSMADRLAHEIGNALVPVSTHQQLLAHRYHDPDFRSSLDIALAESVDRIARLSNQLKYLARDTIAPAERLPLGRLLEDAFNDARKHHTFENAQLTHNASDIWIEGDRVALRHAMSEIFLNALQATPDHARLQVRAETAEEGGAQVLRIEFSDNGPGFTADAFEKAVQPFFTTRNVGLGLGLAVSRKIISGHRGRLEVRPPKAGEPGVVRVILPMGAPAGGA